MSFFGPFCDDIPVKIAAVSPNLAWTSPKWLSTSLLSNKDFFMLLSMNLYSKILLKRVFLPFFLWNCYKDGKNVFKIGVDEPRVNVYMETMLKKIFDYAKYEFIQ